MRAKGYTSISSMSGTFDVRSGVANTNDLKATLDVGSMAAAGTINLVNEALGMHLTAVLSKGYSQSVGGTGVGGYLNTALGNKNGELVLPVIITGTMSHPTVAPDVQKLAEMKLNNIIPNAAGLLGGGKGGAGGIVGALLGGGPAAGPASSAGGQTSSTNPAATTTGCPRRSVRPQEETEIGLESSYGLGARSTAILGSRARDQEFPPQLHPKPKSRPAGRLLFYNENRYVPVASSNPCSSFSWHSMQ